MKNPSPLITIITVCFNSSLTIEKTILSVIEQNFINLEYVIIDGGSRDNTMEIVKKYATDYPFIKYISENDYGIYNAMNKGIKMSSGELIGIINSDDWYEADTFKIVRNYYKEHGNAIYYGFQRLIKIGKEYNIERTNYEFLEERMIQHPSCFITKELYEMYGLYDEKYKSASDYDFMLRMKMLGVKFVTIDNILVNFTLGGMSSSIQGTIENLNIKKKYNLINKKNYYLKWLEIHFKYIFHKLIRNEK